jgi:phosphatidate cytidylyltransferase
MINNQLQKRILTSMFLFILLILMYYYLYILIISLITISVLTWIEFNGLISKIFKKRKIKDKFFKFFFKSLSLLYLSILMFLIIIINSKNSALEIFIIYSLFISINSDIGGLIFGKIFKGKKLTKISPQKTISGSIGSFIFSLSLIPIFRQYLLDYDILKLLIITLLISFSSQIGDLFISFLKRKAKVKNTSDLLPGHGGILDRIDGIIFAIPIGLLFLNFL